MEHLNELEKVNLNVVKEHTDKIVVLLSKNHAIKLSCRGPLNIEMNLPISIQMYHHLVYVDTIYVKKQTKIRKEDNEGQKSGKLTDETKMKFHLLYSISICKN